MRILLLSIFFIIRFSAVSAEEYSWKNEEHKKYCRKKMQESYEKIEANLKEKIKNSQLSEADNKERPSLFSPTAVYANCLLTKVQE